jgi:hypothetical protein
MECKSVNRAATIATWVIVSLVSWAAVPPAHACSDALSTLVAAALRPALEKEPLCRDLKKKVATPIGSVTLGVDHTEKVELRSLQYCASEASSSLEASVYVKCKTSDAAVVKFSIDETFDVKLTVLNDSCELTDFKVMPRGEIGQLVVALAGLSDRMKQAVAQQIRTLCK